MNYLFLLDKTQARKFLNEKSSEIFNEHRRINVKSVKRYKTFNEEGALNVLFNLDVNSKPVQLRASTSNFLDKEHDFNAMGYFYDNGFKEPPFLVPEPVAYLRNEKILFYKNIDGYGFADIFGGETAATVELVKKCAELAHKIHRLKVPSTVLFNPDLLFEDFQYQLISEKFPEVGNLNIVIKKIKNLLPTEEKSLCHGDFNLNNLLVLDSGIGLIDFGMTSIFYKEIDLASFVAHLRQELEKNQSLYKELKTVFLKSYGFYNEKTFNLLIALIDARLLEIKMKYESSKYNAHYIFGCLKDDLKKVNIPLQNET